MRVKTFVIVFSILIGLGLLGFAVNNFLGWRQGEKLRVFQVDVENLFVALQKYKERVGTYPTGSNSDVANALSGKNTRGVIVVVSNRIPTNEKGEFVDPWGNAADDLLRREQRARPFRRTEQDIRGQSCQTGGRCRPRQLIRHAGAKRRRTCRCRPNPAARW